MSEYIQLGWALHEGRAQDLLPGRYEGQVDLVLTSPPYDGMRDFAGGLAHWDFEAIAGAIVPTLKPGGVIAWNVQDQIIDGGESMTSFRQALHFGSLGLRLHQTLYYHRPQPRQSQNRYARTVQYVFVFSLGAPAYFDPICDRRNFSAGRQSASVFGRHGDEKRRKPTSYRELPQEGPRQDIWLYFAGGHGNSVRPGGEDEVDAHDHPSIMPYLLAADLIRSYCPGGGLVLDPMAGSGTTIRAAIDQGRLAVGCEVVPEYCALARQRLLQPVMMTP